MNYKYLKWAVLTGTLLLLVFATVIVSLIAGEMTIKIGDLPGIFHEKSGIEYSVLTKIRIPRIITAVSVGGALSITGAILQGIYRNPLVEPYTLGISGGAVLGVSIAIVLGLHLTLGSFILPVSGFTGSLATIFLVYILSMKKGNISINRMLLIGVMISFISSSAMMFLMSISNKDSMHGIMFWMMGSLDEPNSALIKVVFFSSFAGLLISYFYARPLNALRLGQEKARHLGINTGITVRILFIVASLLTGICVSVAGIIGFVGLVIPHIIRNTIGSDYRVLLIASFLGGSFFILVCDLVARTVIAPNELPIGVITGLIGGLVFIIILTRQGIKAKIG